MLLEHLVKSDNFMHLERYVNEGLKGEPFNHEVSARYSPRDSHQHFELPFFEVDPSEVQVLGDSTQVIKGQLARLYFHPDYFNGGPFCQEYANFFLNLSEIAKSSGHIEVSPTSSSRTLLDLSGERFIKLSYHARIGRWMRGMSYETVKRHCQTSDELAQILRGRSGEKWGILREHAGSFFKIGKQGFGTVFRERVAYPYVNDTSLVPFFSLYSKDIFCPDDSTLLRQLFRNSTNPGDFLLNRIIFPIVDYVIDMFRCRGLIPDVHAQNSLLEIDSSLEVRRVIFRDFHYGYDNSLREEKGFGTSEYYSVAKEKDLLRYYQRHSEKFDWMLGRFLLDPLLVEAQNCGLSKEQLECSIKGYVRAVFDDIGAFLPDGLHYEIVPRVFKGSPEYIEKHNPKYR